MGPVSFCFLHACPLRDRVTGLIEGHPSELSDCCSLRPKSGRSAVRAAASEPAVGSPSSPRAGMPCPGTYLPIAILSANDVFAAKSGRLAPTNLVRTEKPPHPAQTRYRTASINAAKAGDCWRRLG